jgi:bla regulator protein blaR1
MSDSAHERKHWNGQPLLLGLAALFALSPAVRATAAEGAQVAAAPSSMAAIPAGDRSSYVLVSGSSVVTLGASGTDVGQARRLHRGAGGDFLWAHREDKAWVVRDAGILAAAHDLLDPQQRLGERQGELGEEQAELGEQQGELGEKLGKIGGHQGDLGERRAALVAELAQRAASGKRTDRLEERLREIQEEQRKLGARQAELGAGQAALGRKQRELSAQQSQLGKQQAALARRAEAELGTLFEEAIRKGLAQEVTR